MDVLFKVYLLIFMQVLDLLLCTDFHISQCMDLDRLTAFALNNPDHQMEARTGWIRRHQSGAPNVTIGYNSSRNLHDAALNLVHGEPSEASHSPFTN